MVYSEDVREIFRRGMDDLGGREILLLPAGAVVSGHKGLASLSSQEIGVRLREGIALFSGEGLRLEKASPSEIFISGRIRSVILPEKEES